MKIIASEKDSNTIVCVIVVKKSGITFNSSLYTDENFIESFKILSLFNDDNSSSRKENLQKKNSSKLKARRIIYIKCLWLAALLKELANSTIYRKLFIKNYKNISKLKYLKMDLELLIKLDYENMQALDYNWEYRCNYLLQEKEHLASAMSWLSTLGGAFSALGDLDPSFAERASVTSYKQMLIACRLGDMNLIARCWLWCSLSLIQKKKYKKACSIIHWVFNWAKQKPEGRIDHRLFNMCHGIWAKLQYERSLHNSSRKLMHSSSRRL